MTPAADFAGPAEDSRPCGGGVYNALSAGSVWLSLRGSRPGHALR